MKRNFTTIKVCVAALLLATGAAHAIDTKICAVISKTPDRFVAFREKPGTAGKMIAALREGFPLSIERSDQFLEEQEYLRYKNWTKWVELGHGLMMKLNQL